ncbi:MAG: rRNA maturation RNase YbeY [Marinilabiliales bacterium]|nr:MAG: rRNA maturation RNase YbeY [Marinilabiliales bacterium]
MSLEIHFEDIDKQDFSNLSLPHLLNIISEEEKITIGDINIIFCSDKYLLKMNKQYLSHDYFTDIITFDYSEENILSGDLFISLDRVNDNAKHFSVTLLNELARVVIHGIMHLTGYNDHTQEEQKVMRKQEDKYLSLLFS